MRISDWSSDVCSSDLADRPQISREERRLAGQSHLIAANVEAAQPVDQLPRDLADREVAPVSVGIGKTIEQRRHSGGERHFEEIGRASCRESVVQYVDNSVVAYHFTNN